MSVNFKEKRNFSARIEICLNLDEISAINLSKTAFCTRENKFMNFTKARHV